MATAKKATVKKSSPKRVKKVKLESFKVCKETLPFVSFQITEQTVYWSVLLMLILVLALWSLQIQVNISDILNSVKGV